ncbi:MAG TPA: PDZ domain-containing protein [Candidatus Eisenbacteria bacterium]|nr:PDZ domain-containing protein [Candidatus Eisenbacteria bacterium]
MTHRFHTSILALSFALAFSVPSTATAEPTPLRRDPGSFLGVLDSLRASILTIVATPNVPAGSSTKKKRLIGTGIAASSRDVVTTASLAFPDGVVRVLLGDGVERRASLRGVDRQSNLAVFRLDQPVLTSLRRAAPQSLAVGTWVAVISNVAVSKPQTALGQVVGRGERVGFPYTGDVLEIDAPSYPGLAGGAVLNEDGEWVAVIVGRGLQGPPSAGSRVGMPNGGAPAEGGVLLAVPVDQVDRIVDDIVKHGTVQRGFLGIRLKRGAPLPGDTLGVRVDGVIPGSPAAVAGIRRGDRILALDGSEVRTPEELVLIVAEMRPGDDSQVTVLRDDEILSLRVVIGSNTAAPAFGRNTQGEDRDSERKVLEDHLNKLKAEQQDLEQQLRGMNHGDSTTAQPGDDGPPGAPESPDAPSR